MDNRKQHKQTNAMYPWHGFLGSTQSWEPPVMTQHCDVEARPGYQTEKAHEYEDTEEVLHEKVLLLADLMTRSKHCLVYSGAGLSTASGINDYATKSNTKFAKTKKKSGYAAQPTFAHRALVAMQQKGLIRHWVQQNHDGLPQKVGGVLHLFYYDLLQVQINMILLLLHFLNLSIQAGLPQHVINEIHGAWYDPTNPVVPMKVHYCMCTDDLLTTLMTAHHVPISQHMITAYYLHMMHMYMSCHAHAHVMCILCTLGLSAR